MKKTMGSLAAIAGVFAIAGSAHAFSPENVECIAPANPGGGWDFTCRSVGKILYDLKLVPEPVKVTNMPGGGGGVAFGYVVGKRNDDANLLVAASTATTSRLATNQFAGLTADQVRWVASLGADFGVIAVSKDAPYKNLGDLMAAVKADPDKIAFGGGSAVGGWDHLKILIVAKAAGITDARSVKYVSFNSGGKALTQLLGNHVQAVTGDVSEIKGQLAAGNVRALAVLSPERLSTDPDIPTAREQGFDAIGANWRGFYLPKDVSDDVHQSWGKIMAKLYESEDWKKAMEANGLAPFYNGGAQFDDFVRQNIADIEQLSKDVGLLK